MRRSLARFSGPELLVHTRSLADCITTTSGFRFSVHTAISDEPANKTIIRSNKTGKKGKGILVAKMREQQVSILNQIVSDLHDPCSQSALSVVGSQILNPPIESFAFGHGFQRALPPGDPAMSISQLPRRI
jgi:hypothetical protein